VRLIGYLKINSLEILDSINTSNFINKPHDGVVWLVGGI